MPALGLWLRLGLGLEFGIEEVLGLGLRLGLGLEEVLGLGFGLGLELVLERSLFQPEQSEGRLREGTVRPTLPKC